MSEQNMMLVEAMKELRTIEKRMTNNMQDIRRYSSMVSTEKPLFESEERQKREVKSLVQANQDLATRYLKIKTDIEYTNLMTSVELDGKTYTISELLVLKRKMAKMMERTYSSMTDQEAQSRMHMLRAPEGQSLQIVRLYTEDDRRKGLRQWQDLYNTIDSRLEVVNATTPLQELPS